MAGKLMFVLVALILFVGYFTLFWNMKHWKLSAWKKAGLALLCMLVSVLMVGMTLGSIATIFP